MILSFSSFLAASVAGSIMVLFLVILLRGRSPLSRKGLNILLLFIIFIGIRLIFPLEFFYTITFTSKTILPFLVTKLFEHPFLSFWGISIYMYQVLVGVWIFGTLYYLFQIVHKHRKMKRFLRCLNPQNSVQITKILKEILKKPRDKKTIHIIQTPYVPTPALTGFINPIILLPDISFEDEELRYILTHELDHFYRHDLWWKVFFEILSAVYWWNPLMFLLKKQLSALLELKADDTVISSLCLEKRIAYLECLTRIHKNQIQQLQDSNLLLTFSNASPDTLLNRASYIINKKRKKHSSGLLLVICIVTLVLSSFFVVEPYFIPPEVEKVSLAVIPEECYFIKLKDGLYDFYSGDTYCGTATNPYTDDFKDYPIYTESFEVIR